MRLAATTAAYRRILSMPGATRLLVAAIATWVGGAMTPVAFLLFAREATRSYASAGAVLAALTAGGASFAPLRGALVDRRGADRAVRELAIPGLVTDAALILTGRAHAAPAVLIGIAFVSGATVAPVGTGMRTVWSATIAELADRQSAYAVMAATGEVSFIVGPLVAGLLAAASATLSVAAAAALAIAGALLFSTAEGARAHGRAVTAGSKGRVLASGGVRVVILTATLFGLSFGSLDVALPVIARRDGSTAAAGVLLSALAVGLGAASLIYGRHRSDRTAVARYAPLTLLAGLGLVPLLALPPLGVLVALVLVAGACFAPVMLTHLTILDELVPKHVAGRAYSLVGSFYTGGAASGAALAGSLVDGPGVRAALALSCGAILAAAAVAALGYGPGGRNLRLR